MKIPRYIYITENRQKTKEAFKNIFKSEHVERLLMVASSGTGKKLEWLFELFLSSSQKSEKLLIAKDDKRALDRTMEKIKKGSFDVCIGMGGGRILDIAKYASFSQKSRFLSFPTLLSHDGIASPVVVIRKGKHWSESRSAESPRAVIVDIKTVSEAPSAAILSGIGDLVANLFASMDAEMFKEQNRKEYNQLSTAISRSASFLVFPGFSGMKITKISQKAFRQLAWGLILSGISMSIAGNSIPASGAEHKISHAIDYICSPSVSHGFTVSVGNVISAFLHGQYEEEIVRFNISLDLPVLCDDIGISKDDFIDIINHARSIKPDRYTVLEEKRLKRKDILKLLNRIEAMREKIKSETEVEK